MFLIGMRGFDALVLQEKLLFQPISLKSKLIHQKGQTWDHMIISILFVNEHHKYVLFTGIHGIDALVL